MKARSRLLIVTFVAVLLAGAAWLVGAPMLHSAVLGITSAGVGLLLPLEPPVAHQTPPRQPERARDGIRRDLARLAWSFGQRGRRGVGTAALARLADVARRRLAEQGIDADDPTDRDAAEQALGTFTTTVLFARPDPTTVSHRDLSRCLTAVERLGSHAGPPTSRSQRL